jgi:nitronate monooxygenase
VKLFQAPMANNQPPGFAAAVCEAGAIGTIAGAAMSADDLRAEIRAMPKLPFCVNLFAAPYLRDDFSFTFCLVDPAPLHDAGIEVLGTATTAEEADVLRETGVDYVVAQGAEAGGHRGSFLDGFPLVPLAELVPAISGVPVIAAGGITTRDDVHAAIELGAVGAQVGTAFLFTRECGRPREHLDALRAHDTVVTDAYTGRPMRAARDDVLAGLMHETPLPFPQQRQVSRERGPLFMGGTGAKRCREQSIAELVAELRA